MNRSPISRRRLVVLVAALGLTLAACGGSSTPDPNTSTTVPGPTTSTIAPTLTAGETFEPDTSGGVFAAGTDDILPSPYGDIALTGYTAPTSTIRSRNGNETTSGDVRIVQFQGSFNETLAHAVTADIDGIPVTLRPGGLTQAGVASEGPFVLTFKLANGTELGSFDLTTGRATTTLRTFNLGAQMSASTSIITVPDENYTESYSVTWTENVTVTDIFLADWPVLLGEPSSDELATTVSAPGDRFVSITIDTPFLERGGDASIGSGPCETRQQRFRAGSSFTLDGVPPINADEVDANNPFGTFEAPLTQLVFKVAPDFAQGKLTMTYAGEMYHDSFGGCTNDLYTDPSSTQTITFAFPAA